MKTFKERNVLNFSGSCIYWVGFGFKLEDKNAKEKKEKWQYILEKD